MMDGNSLPNMVNSESGWAPECSAPVERPYSPVSGPSIRPIKPTLSGKSRETDLACDLQATWPIMGDLVTCIERANLRLGLASRLEQLNFNVEQNADQLSECQ